MKNNLNIKEITIFAMLSALMYVTKLILYFLPNVHLLTIMIVSITIVFRRKALYSIYGYVFIEGLFAGFAIWWIPYLYIWLVPWIVVMILPKNVPQKLKLPIYMVICFMHGFLFGTLYAPIQALFYGMSFEATIAWIISGLPFDITHAIGNAVASLFIFPIVKILNNVKLNVC